MYKKDIVLIPHITIVNIATYNIFSSPIFRALFKIVQTQFDSRCTYGELGLHENICAIYIVILNIRNNVIYHYANYVK